jgi:FtsH-binding integral membrane protein
LVKTFALKFLACYPSVARKVPLNYILTLIFTLAESVTISWICAFYDPKHVVIAVTITLGMVLGLTVFACCTRSCDFTIWGGMLFAALFSLTIMTFFLMFWNSYYVTILIATLGVIIFSAYLVYDTQLIVGGKSRQYQIDDYIMAAINLYLDITRIFMYVLALVGGR